jgi:hypothetical protein
MLDRVHKIADIVAAFAIVASLIFVAIQIRSNTRALQASASSEAAHSWANTNEAIVGDESLIQTAIKAYNPETGPDDLDDLERARMGLLHRSLFQKLEGQYYLFKYGYLEPEIWSMRRDWATGLVTLPVFQDWWETELEQSVYTGEFINALSSEDPVSVVVPGAPRDATGDDSAKPD